MLNHQSKSVSKTANIILNIVYFKISKIAQGADAGAPHPTNPKVLMQVCSVVTCVVSDTWTLARAGGAADAWASCPGLAHPAAPCTPSSTWEMEAGVTSALTKRSRS